MLNFFPVKMSLFMFVLFISIGAQTIIHAETVCK